MGEITNAVSGRAGETDVKGEEKRGKARKRGSEEENGMVVANGVSEELLSREGGHRGSTVCSFQLMQAVGGNDAKRRRMWMRAIEPDDVFMRVCIHCGYEPMCFIGSSEKPRLRDPFDWGQPASGQGQR